MIIQAKKNLEITCENCFSLYNLVRFCLISLSFSLPLSVSLFHPPFSSHLFFLSIPFFSLCRSSLSEINVFFSSHHNYPCKLAYQKAEKCCMRQHMNDSSQSNKWHEKHSSVFFTDMAYFQATERPKIDHWSTIRRASRESRLRTNNHLRHMLNTWHSDLPVTFD